MKTRFILLLALTAMLVLAISPISAQMTYNEAPMLAEKVAAGELPPVEERLPANPLVVVPLEQGQYGGTWRRVMTGSGDGANLLRTVSYEGLFRWDPSFSEVIPNFATGYEVNEEGTEWTFSIREGVKWSDGVPFTTGDIQFWYEDIATNRDVRPASPGWLVYAGEVAQFEVIDDVTFKFIFSVPAGNLMTDMAHPSHSTEMLRFPRHYYEQFHARYNENIDALVREAGLETWMELLGARGLDGTTRYRPEIPTIDAWMPMNVLDGDTTQLRMERNPYYWKVDTEGNQYPYLDNVVFDVIADREVMILRAAAGEIDMQTRHIGNLANKAFLFDNQETGNYRFFDTDATSTNSFNLMLNMTSKNPVLREIFQQKDFRIAVSHAIDRQRIIDTVFVSQGIPAQSAPLPGTPFYNERLATQYIEYDPALSAELLDALGYTLGSDGFRVGPDGNRISFAATIAENPVVQDILEFIRMDLQALGIELIVRALPRASYADIVFQNNHDATSWAGGAGIQPALDMRYYMPVNNESLFANAWAFWGIDPMDPVAEEPDNEIALRQIELWKQLSQTVDTDARAEIINEILDLAADAFWLIGISTPAPLYGVVRNDFCNVPARMWDSWEYPHPGPTNPFTYFRGECTVR